MNARGFVAVLAVAGCLLTAGTGGVTATQTTPTPSCGADATDRVVVTFETGESAAGATVLPGTTLFVFLCNDGEPLEHETLWGLADDPAFRTTDAGRSWVQLTVTDTPNRTVRLGELVQRRDATGGTFTVAETNRVTWTSATGNETVRLRFGEADRRTEFTATAEELTAAHGRLDRLLSRVPRDVSTDGGFETNVTDIASTLDRIERETGDLHRTAFAATRAGNTSAVSAVVDRSATDAAAAEQRVRDRLTAYRTALSNAESAATGTVRLFFGGGLLGGLIAGSTAGVVWSRRIRERLIRERGWNSDVTISLDRFVRPLVVAVVVFLLGVSYALIRGGTELLGVLL